VTGTDDATAEVRPDQNAGMQSCGEGFGAFHVFFPCTNCYLMTCVRARIHEVEVAARQPRHVPELLN